MHHQTTTTNKRMVLIGTPTMTTTNSGNIMTTNSTSNNRSSNNKLLLILLLIVLAGCSGLAYDNYLTRTALTKATEELILHRQGGGGGGIRGRTFGNNNHLNIIAETNTNSNNNNYFITTLRKLGFIVGEPPPNVPSPGIAHLPPEEQKLAWKRGPFGGRGDDLSLGGFVSFDHAAFVPALYEYWLKVINIRSLLDVGCGKGAQTKYFLDKGLDVLCVEGSRDGVTRNVLPRNRIVEHDFTLAPWFPNKTYDLAMMVEVTEHISRQYIQNYMPALKQAAVIVKTHAIQPGYHHVEVHYDDPWWWRARFEAHSLVYSEALTNLFREICTTNKQGKWYRTAEVYINPQVASRNEHQHIFGGPGCLKDSHTPGSGDSNAPIAGTIGSIPCSGRDLLPERYRPIWSGVPEGPWSRHERIESKVMTDWNITGAREAVLATTTTIPPKQQPQNKTVNK
jgi:hypothetical protein